MTLGEIIALIAGAVLALTGGRWAVRRKTP